MTPKAEGMRIPRQMVETYGYGCFVNYPYDEFVAAHMEEFNEHPFPDKKVRD
jgi:hypothetical protein